MYGDLDSDQGTFNLLAALMFIAAVFAAFNLTSRIVEAQRREIGIGMALGATRRTIALRPLLVGAEIALLGVVFGVGVGLLVGAAMKTALEGFFPLPMWETPFRPGRFAGAAALGFLLPFLATTWPVWRAVRVEPVRAIRTGHLASRGGGLAPLVKRMPLPGGTFGQMPVRGVLRAPRRTILTAIGIGAAVMALVGILGMLDSVRATIDRGDAEMLRGDPDRVEIDLAGFQPLGSGVIRTIEGSPEVRAAEPLLKVGGALGHGSREFDVSIELLDLESPVWHPTIGSRAPAAGLPPIVVAEEAARDLGILPGDVIQVRHPLRTGEFAFATSTTTMRVVGVHPSPVRSFAFMDVRDASVMGLSGMANVVQVLPAAGSSVGDVKRAMFGSPGVASVQPVSAAAQTLRDVFEQMGGVLAIIELFALALALLVAFNAVSINVDERAREHATMFAFGMRLRTLLRMTGVESLIVGLLGTLLGIGLGALALGALMRSATAEAPEIGILSRLAPETVLAAVGLGALVALLAPLLTARRLGRMDVASTLRVME
jgi:putative ABC transport system permease protein